ncbi:DNA polymerase Y family protein [Saccharopolyspora sp. HNM0983]|uniref:DNA polymerase Y family protein n=1 Tax=Saccharopolyspora montiporae TaxID=2781240 RepID=A0A929BCH3_9PSEU|nr:DNA polymerase Y family protein [Saccharopolyspora sp. HNM0983]MBE9375093.1 DNA polymerase Y family protein [Saccharopolyspora sp. HNM0983]
MSPAQPRRLVVWCPDWPVVAAGRAVGADPLTPAAVFTANRVVACSAVARRSGVGRGMRRREAQGRCPGLLVHEHDPGREARFFEPVAAAVESLVPGVEVVRPGLIAVPARGPARYFGSEEAAGERLVDQVAAQAGVECQVGAADGLFAAILAARSGVQVEPGGSGGFLAERDVEELDRLLEPSAARDLVALLRRLGITTLGRFAGLPAGDVATRFGAAALAAHRAAGGVEERPVQRRSPSPDLAVTEQFDPPVERVDAAAFAAKAMADRLHAQLREKGIACTRLGISAHTGNGEELHRVWRCAEPLTPAGTADRVRWQLDGWLTGRSAAQRPTAGVHRLVLAPEEVVPSGSLQLDLLEATTGAADARAGRALTRVQGMLGPDGVLTAVLGGGRDPRDRIRLVPWGDERVPALQPDLPWPGRVPPPSPSVVPDEPWSVAVLDADERPVEVSPRNLLTGAPCRVVLGGGRSRAVSRWAGPWPNVERWWLGVGGGAGDARRSVRMQVVLADVPGSPAGEVALLLVAECGSWWVQGTYR